MKKVFNLLADRKFYWLWSLLTSGVFIYACYAFWFEFLSWDNLILVAANAVLQALSVAVMSLLLFTSGKKETNTKKKAIAAFAGAAVYESIQFIILPLVNVGGNYNRRAIYVAYAVGFVLYAFAFVKTLVNASKSGLKILQRTVAFACLAAFIGLVGFTGYRYIPLEWSYGIYRSATGYEGEIEDSGVFAGFAYSTQKIQPTDDITGDVEGHICLAKNEREGIQLLVAAEEEGKTVTVTLSDFSDGKGNTMSADIFTEVYTSVPGYGTAFSEDYADALVPYEADEIELTKDSVSAFYIETVSDIEQAQGDYTATLKVETGDKTAEYEITATVWNFALPETPSSATAMGIFSEQFYVLNGYEGSSYGWNGATGSLSDEGRTALYKAYYDYLLEHRVSAYSLPYDILDERADAYMSDPRVTSFCVPYSDDDETLVKYYEKVASNPIWAEKAYFYPIDEPCDEAAYLTYTEMTDRLAKLCPGYNMVTPFCESKVEIGGEDKSSVELQTGRSSILCGCSDDVMTGDTLSEMYTSRDEANSKLWWYVCCGPSDKAHAFTSDELWNNMFVHQDAIRQRELFWQEKKYDLTGFLYWDSVYYENSNPWESCMTYANYNCAGDGCLLYPGGYIGLDEPIGTIRIKNVCDGLEDYDYLTLAEEKFGNDWINEKINLISTDITSCNLDYSVLAEVRNSIGEALSK